MADSFQQEVEDRIAGGMPEKPKQGKLIGRAASERPAWAAPGSVRAQEIERDNAQQGVGADFMDGVRTTAAAGIKDTIQTEAPALIEETWGTDSISKAYEAEGPVGAALQALNVGGTAALTIFGYRSGEKDYDKEEKYEELTKGIPFEYHADILEHDNFEAASRARNNVMEQMERGKRMTQQDGGQLAALAGSLFDVDMPLVAFSGGAYGAAKVAGASLKASRILRVPAGAALRVSGALQGANAGAQAGAIVGAFDAANRETVGWQDMAEMSLQSMLLGTAIGTAVKGDVRLSVQEAQKEFYGRIAADDNAFKQPVQLDTMRGENIKDYQQQQEPFILEDEVGESSVGAIQVTPGMRMQRPTYLPNATITPTNHAWIDAAAEWRHNSGWAQRKADDDATWWAKVAMSGGMNLTTNNFNRLYKSKSAVANYLAGNIFESTNGLGRGKATAATRMENYHRRMQQHLGEELRQAQTDWARANGHTWQGSGYHITENGKAVFNREVMLELNDRRLGMASTRSPEIRRAADQYELAGEEALNIAKGRQGEQSVDGFENVPTGRGYTPYKWSGSKIKQLEADGVVTRDDLVQAMAQAYREAGMGVGKDAEAVAKAVIHRALTRDAEMDMSVMGMLTGDGKDFMRESMILGGMREADADAVIERLTGAQHNRSKEAFAKTRNDIDMGMTIPTRDGSHLSVVDLFDHDMHGVWQRYTRQMSGSAALARHGIINRAERREIIDAMRAEQAALGEEPMQAELIEAMLSHFNAGPVHGFAAGVTNEGIGHAALAKRIANLSLLEKLGVSQIAETDMAIAQNGIAN